MFLFLIAFTLCVGWILFYEFYWKRRNLPPGPIPFPLIGNVLAMTKYEPGYEAFAKWRREYGPVFTIWIGVYPFVVYTDYSMMKELFVKNGDITSNKFQYPELGSDLRGGEYGIVDSNGPLWMEHRRFALHVFRDFGLGKSLMEEKIISEVDFLTSALRDSESNVHSIMDNITVAVGSIINQLLFGYRFTEKNVDKFFYLTRLLKKYMQAFGSPVAFLITGFPKLRHLPFFKQFYKGLKDRTDDFFNFFDEEIDKHINELKLKDSSEEATDYVEAYLKECQKRDDIGEDHTFQRIQLKNSCFDLWIAGMETTANTLSWGVAYILHNPEVQEKLHKELDTIIGSDRTITMADKNSLPYMNAVINETQRMANLLPLNLFHSFNQEYETSGYKIPKGVGVIAQISSVLYDEEIFPNPHKFDPDRFIDVNGDLIKREQLIPFSLGKRQCLGEGLARMELFLITANLFHRFKFEPHGEAPSLKKSFGITVHPEPFQCKITYRL